MPDTPAVSITALLKKTEHYDKDERYMATSDLCEVLKRQSGEGGGSATLDSNIERQICTAVLRLLHDKSNDVQAIAVKTLGVLLTTVKEEQVLEIADSLADQVLDASKSELRDVYAIGLRTLVKTIPPSMGNQVAQRLVGRLLEGIRSSQNEEIVLSCLDILTELLARFGGSAVAVTRQHEAILQMCLSQLSSTAPVVRKRAGSAMACLSVVLTDALLMRMVEALLGQIDQAEGIGKEGRRKTAAAKRTQSGNHVVGDTRSLIRTMCAVSGQVGHRLGQEQIDRIVPIFLRFTDPEDAATGDDDDDHDNGDDIMDEGDGEIATELRESCFMGFESFVTRCPKEVESHLEKIIQTALAYMCYDPNYSYGEDQDEEDQDEELDDEDEYEDEYEEDEDFDDDDDDESWKVRRAAVRALKAVVETKKHNPALLWSTQYSVRRGKSSVVATALVNRFKEREENCRVGVIECFTRLLEVTIDAAASGVLTFAMEESMTDTEAVIDFRSVYTTKLVKACEKILGTKKGKERSKSGTLALLATLCKAPGGVGGQTQVSSVFKHVQVFLKGGTEMALHREGASKALRLDALLLVHNMLASPEHVPAHIRICLSQGLLPEICDAVKEQWYKVSAEALRSLAAVPQFFVTGYEEGGELGKRTKESTDVAGRLYTAIEPLLAAHDVDQEIKECALKATASLLCWLHPMLADNQKARLLELLLERLRNETTRIAAIKTLSSVAEGISTVSPVDLSPILADALTDMASFLKLHSRSLKQTALESMDVVTTNHGAGLADGVLFSSVVQEFAPLIVDSDLHVAHLTLSVAVSILKVCPSAGPAIKDQMLEPALLLTVSSLLQDYALQSLVAFFKQLVLSEAVAFKDLLGLLRERLSDGVGKQGVYNLAECIAAVTATTTADLRKEFLDELLALLETGETPTDASRVRQVQLGLLVTGDAGRMVDLSQEYSAANRLKTVYLTYFDSSSEDLKQAAAYALGNAAVGSQSDFIPAIVSRLDGDNKKQLYLVLSALREFIRCSKKTASTSLTSTLSDILPPLEKACAEKEEGVRTMVAECLGSLACLQPVELFPKLQALVEAHSNIAAPEGTIEEGDEVSEMNSLVCWTVATSVKLAISGKIDPAVLSQYMPTFVKLLEQKEIHVRIAALLLVYSSVHHMPQVVSGLLKDSVFPYLFEVSGLKMTRVVDLGPFKHTVDDALPLRKAALSIFATCLESAPGSLDIGAFMSVLAQALGDAEDIQLHAHQIILSMCSKNPSYVVNEVDSFVDPLEKTIRKKPGQKTGTELERLNDWIKSALRVILTLAKVEGTMSSRKFLEFNDRVKGDAKYTAMIQSLSEES
eukprot:scaffold5237_cov179-Amphora_coffeaeformis.AAC.4